MGDLDKAGIRLIAMMMLAMIGAVAIAYGHDGLAWFFAILIALFAMFGVP